MCNTNIQFCFTAILNASELILFKIWHGFLDLEHKITIIKLTLSLRSSTANTLIVDAYVAEQ